MMRIQNHSDQIVLMMAFRHAVQSSEMGAIIVANELIENWDKLNSAQCQEVYDLLPLRQDESEYTLFWQHFIATTANKLKEG